MLQLKIVKPYIAGISLCLILASCAKLIADVTGFPAMLLAIIMGLFLSPFFNADRWKSGFGFASKNILRFGVVLIGARFVFSDVLALGLPVLILVTGAIVLVTCSSVFFAKHLGLNRHLGMLIGGATAICGASAALAISAVLPQSKDAEKYTAVSVLVVTAIGTLALISYPLILPLFELSDAHSALLVGGTIHDVAQVVGAGYSISDPVGDQAVLVKLVRVFMLVPMVLVLGILSVRWFGQDEGQGQKSITVPLFLIGFIFMIALNSLGLFATDTQALFKEISRWAFLIALVAIGLKTPLSSLKAMGVKPFLLVILNTSLLILIYSLYVIAS